MMRFSPNSERLTNFKENSVTWDADILWARQ
jgi:hypothetical protein